MMLGKRTRHPIKRTTSMTEITVDQCDVEKPPPSDNQNTIIISDAKMLEGPDDQNGMVGPNEYNHGSIAMLSPRYHRTSDYCFPETSDFLWNCGLCKRRLAPGRDIYMYRGDTAFCSVECREQQMKHDERKDKCSRVLQAASKKGESHHTQSSSPASEASNKNETFAAA